METTDQQNHNKLRVKYKQENKGKSIGSFGAASWEYTKWLETNCLLLKEEIIRLDGETIREVNNVVSILANFSAICFSPAEEKIIRPVIDKYKDINARKLVSEFYESVVSHRNKVLGIIRSINE